jgi:hypothetical protein
VTCAAASARSCVPGLMASVLSRTVEPRVGGPVRSPPLPRPNNGNSAEPSVLLFSVDSPNTEQGLRMLFELKRYVPIKDTPLGK